MSPDDADSSPETPRPTTPAVQDGQSRGQTFTVEAVASIVLVAAVVTLLGASLTLNPAALQADEQQAQAEMQQDMAGILTTAHADGTLKSLILAFDAETSEYQQGSALTGTQGRFIQFPDGAFGDRLIAFTNRHSASINIELIPRYDGTGSTGPRQSGEPVTLLTTGVPGAPSFTTSTTVTLYDSDRLQSPPRAHEPETTHADLDVGNGPQLAEPAAATFPVPQATPTATENPRTYNVVEVRLTIWYTTDE